MTHTIEVGNYVAVTSTQHEYPLSDYPGSLWGTQTLREDDLLEVVKVLATVAHVRKVEEPTKGTYSIRRTNLILRSADGKVIPVPEGSIPATDERVLWIFDALDKELPTWGLNSKQFRQALKSMKFPTPRQPYTVTRDLDGVALSLTIEARSQHEAEQRADAILGSNQDG